MSKKTTRERLQGSENWTDQEPEVGTLLHRILIDEEGTAWFNLATYTGYKKGLQIYEYNGSKKADEE